VEFTIFDLYFTLPHAVRVPACHFSASNELMVSFHNFGM
jgi:hypothetical protein